MDYEQLTRVAEGLQKERFFEAEALCNQNQKIRTLKGNYPLRCFGGVSYEIVVQKTGGGLE